MDSWRQAFFLDKNRLGDMIPFTMSKPEDMGKDLHAQIASRIKRLRKSKGFNLDQMAERTGYTKSYLSQIENLKRDPPISTLLRIAHALGEDVAFLITGESREAVPQKFTVVKPHERKFAMRSSGKGGYNYWSVSHKKRDRVMDAYILTAEFEFPDEPANHEGQELVLMLEGRKEMIYDGNRYIVEEGDCLCYDSNRPHYSRSIGDKPAKFLLVFFGNPGNPFPSP